MQVPGWLLVLLACFSSILIVSMCIVAFFVIRYHLRTRKYTKLHGDMKYVPGKTAAYFRGKYDYSTFVPSTYPITLQSGSPAVYPTFKYNQKLSGSKASSLAGTYQSPHARAIRYQESQTLNRASSLDDHVFRKVCSVKKSSGSPIPSSSNQPNIGDAASKSLRQESPLITEIHDANSSQSSQNSVRCHEEQSSVEMMPVNQDTFYSHSHFIVEDDQSTLTPSYNQEDVQQIVSYDQEISKPPTTRNNPSFLFFDLEYLAAVPVLKITVKHAFDLQPVGDASRQVNSYINLCIVPEDFLWQRTRVVEGNRDPVFNEEFEIRDVLYHKLREYMLCFYVMDSHPVLGERVIGKVLYPLSELRAEQLVDVCKEITPP